MARLPWYMKATKSKVVGNELFVTIKVNKVWLYLAVAKRIINLFFGGKHGSKSTQDR